MNLEYIRNLSRLGIEVWKDIPNFEGFYKVSSLGNVISINFRKTKKKRILKKHKRIDGRKFVHLCKNGVRYSNKVISVLVAITFLNHKPCGHKIVVDHIDNNPLNDRLYNLQLITHRQNTSKDKKGFSKYTGVYFFRNKWVGMIRIKGKKKYLGRYKTELEAANAYKKALEEYETKEVYTNPKNKKIREYSKPNLYEC